MGVGSCQVASRWRLVAVSFRRFAAGAGACRENFCATKPPPSDHRKHVLPALIGAQSEQPSSTASTSLDLLTTTTFPTSLLRRCPVHHEDNQRSRSNSKRT